MNDHEKVNRLRAWFIALIAAIVFFGALVPVAVLYWAQSRIDDAQFDITCVSAQANIDQLRALEEIAEELGIPHRFTVPVLPEECNDH